MAEAGNVAYGRGTREVAFERHVEAAARLGIAEDPRNRLNVPAPRRILERSQRGDRSGLRRDGLLFTARMIDIERVAREQGRRIGVVRGVGSIARAARWRV